VDRVDDAHHATEVRTLLLFLGRFLIVFVVLIVLWSWGLSRGYNAIVTRLIAWGFRLTGIVGGRHSFQIEGSSLLAFVALVLATRGIGPVRRLRALAVGGALVTFLLAFFATIQANLAVHGANQVVRSLISSLSVVTVVAFPFVLWLILVLGCRAPEVPRAERRRRIKKKRGKRDYSK
jgi:hypothetical protein